MPLPVCRNSRVLRYFGPSADFWVAGEVPESTGTAHAVAIHYQDNTVGGWSMLQLKMWNWAL